MNCPVPPPWILGQSSVLNSADIRVTKVSNIINDCMFSDHITANTITADTITANIGITTPVVTGLELPVNDSDAASKEYVDSKTIFEWKNPVVVSTTGPQILSGVPVSIDGYAVIAGDRVLVQFQADPVENGIYIVDSGSWPRAADLNTGQHASGAAVWILEGTQYIHTTFVCDNLPNSDIVGTDPLVFVQFSGGTGTITAGIALTLTGNTLDVNTDTSSISVNGSNELQITNTTVVPGTYGSSTQTPVLTVNSKGQLTSVMNVSTTAPVLSSIFSILSPIQINSLPYVLTAAELLSTYIIVNPSGNSTVTLPSASAIYSQIGAPNFTANMSFIFSILKKNINTLTIIVDPSITNYATIMTLSNNDLSQFILVLNSSTTGSLYPYGVFHTV